MLTDDGFDALFGGPGPAEAADDGGGGAAAEAG
jgi:hypothetical protein